MTKRSKRLIVITRPADKAQALANAICKKGFTPLVTPLLTIEKLKPAVPDWRAYQGLVFTSAQGVQAYGCLAGAESLPVYAVGDSTAQAARAAGYRAVHSAQGNATALKNLLASVVDPAHGPLLYLSAQEIAAPLMVPGLVIERVPVYRAVPAGSFPPELRAALESGEIAAIMFFSVRTAACFADLAQTYGHTAALASIKALCISDSVVKSLRNLPWQDVHVAVRPGRESMIKLMHILD